MALGDLFDRLFRLIGKTYPRILAVALVIFLPISVVFVAMTHHFCSDAADMVQEMSARADYPGSPAPPGVFGRLLSAGIILFTGYLFLLLGLIAATVGVTLLACSEMSEQPLSWREAFAAAFGARFLRVCGQILLQSVIVIGVMCVPILSVALIRVSGWFGLLAAIVIPCAICLVTKLILEWAFTTPVIVWEQAGVLDSFGRSSSLVRGRWWRVFGILLLLSLILQFAISIVTTPLNFVAMWGYVSKIFQMVGMRRNTTPDPRFAADLIRSLGMGFGIVVSVSQLLAVTVSPLIRSVLYFDLRARRGEFLSTSTPESPALPV